jgi:two-component system chemotaxis response regulator CheB
MIRVLIADDSAFMRKVLTDMFSKQADFEVLGTAVNGKDAVDKVKKLQPDLLTMDVNMPVMDGLQALEIIMAEYPMPVLMFSSLTREGTEATIRALEIGAVDFQSKAGGSISKIDTIEDEILAKSRAAAKVNVKRLADVSLGKKIKQENVSSMQKHINMPKREGYHPPERQNVFSSLYLDKQKSADDKDLAKGTLQQPFKLKKRQPVFQPKVRKMPQVVQPIGSNGVVQLGNCPPAGMRKLVVIGTSTGGPKALQSVITKLPKNLPCGVLVVQHMPPGFTRSLAERLDTISEIAVKEAAAHDRIRAGQVYIAPGNYHMIVQPNGAGREIVLNQDPPLASHRPAVDVMFDSVAQFGKDVISVIMTGMGCDGSAGMRKIKSAGGYIIAENEETSVVYGMPKAVVDMGIADEVLPLQDIARSIVEAVKK